MELTKREVSYLYEQPCYRCKWSHINSIDWGLMCVNSDSEHCTDYCPEIPCEHLEIDPELSLRLKAVRDLSEAGKTPRVFSSLQTTGIDKLESHMSYAKDPNEKD